MVGPDDTDRDDEEEWDDDEDGDWDEDEDWEEYDDELERASSRPVNPFVIGGSFLDYCVRKGWLVAEKRRRKTRYYPTHEGIVALREYGIYLSADDAADTDEYEDEE